MNKAKTVDEYISQAPKEVQPKLKELRKIIKSCAPKADEKISYGMPYYDYHGRLAYFASFKNHIGLYIMPRFLDGFEKEVEEYKSGRATIQLPLDAKLPTVLITKLIKNAVKMSEKNK